MSPFFFRMPGLFMTEMLEIEYLGSFEKGIYIWRRRFKNTAFRDLQIDVTQLGECIKTGFLSGQKKQWESVKNWKDFCSLSSHVLYIKHSLVKAFKMRALASAKQLNLLTSCKITANPSLSKSNLMSMSTLSPNTNYDFLIVGGGIVGLATAQELIHRFGITIVLAP